MAAAIGTMMAILAGAKAVGGILGAAKNQDLSKAQMEMQKQASAEASKAELDELESIQASIEADAVARGAYGATSAVLMEDAFQTFMKDERARDATLEAQESINKAMNKGSIAGAALTGIAGLADSYQAYHSTGLNK